MNDRRTFLGLGRGRRRRALFVRPADQRRSALSAGADTRRMAADLGPAALRDFAGSRAPSAPFTSPLLNEHRKGVFVCAGCALPLFSSATKFESGTGWPSFWRALPRDVVTRTDRSFGMARTEVLCARCGGHLGHVFDDGPRPTGLRYCMNGLALRFRPGLADDAEFPALARAPRSKPRRARPGAARARAPWPPLRLRHSASRTRPLRRVWSRK